MESLKNLIKAEALNLGFSFIHFTNTEQSPHFNAFTAWLAEGFNGNMYYLSRDRTIQSRQDPASLMENARSFIVFGFKFLPQPLNKTNTGNGIIASYAVYEDYHAVLKRKAAQLMKQIEDRISRKINSRIFIDSASVMEKDIAFKSGAGWIGKNSLLITPGNGSYQFIGCILTDLELVADPHSPQDLCGDCRCCIQVCPTACITDRHTINASRCIAYLTIEYKGILPRDLRSKIGNHVFGCDLCQTVCPLNIQAQKSHTAPDSIFARKINAEVNLLCDIRLTQEEYLQKFQDTPVTRVTFEGYKRNLIIAMGNSGSIQYVEPLKQILETDPAWLLRLHAAWALAEIHCDTALQVLNAQLFHEKDERVKEEIEYCRSKTC